MIYVLDTDTLSLWQHGHAAVSTHVGKRAPASLAIAVITVQEQIDGWHSQLSRAKQPELLSSVYDRLIACIRFLSQLQILSFTEAAIRRYEQLRSLKLNVGKMDLRIAAIVLENGATMVTRNRRDFQRIPDLLIEDWAS